MRITLLAILAFSAIAADIPDLGVISPKRAVTLDRRSLRPGFQHFLVEIRSELSPTNIVTLTTTNDFLSVTNFVRVPSGPGILGIRSVYQDAESEVALYRYDLRRGQPPAPSAGITHMLGTPEPEKSLTGQLQRIRDPRVAPAPPMPRSTAAVRTPIEGVAYTVVDGNLIPFRPLPYGTNKDYSQHLDELSERAKKRRNE